MRARFTVFAFSRAGAIAAVLNQRGRRRALPLAARIALHVGGAGLIAIGASATLSTGLGPGPFDVLISGVAARSGLSFTLSILVVALALVTVSVLLGARVGLGTLAVPFITGSVIDLTLGLWQQLELAALEGFSGWVIVVSVHLLGVALIGLGAGATIASGLGTGVGDLLAGISAQRLERPIPAIRTCFEVSWVGLGVLLGGSVGIGTVIVAVTIGLSVRYGHQIVERGIGRIAATRLGPRLAWR